MPKRARIVTDADKKNAANFALWQKDARLRRGWLMTELAKRINYGDSTVRLYDADSYAGFDNLGNYRQPKQEYIAAIAQATGADFKAGMIASGRLLVDGDGGGDPHVLRAAADDIKAALEKLGAATGEITREPSEDAVQVKDWYEGTPPGPLRETVYELAKRMYELGRADYRGRTDIIGKRAKDDEP